MEMTNIMKAVIGRLYAVTSKEGKAARDALEPGVYSVDEVVRIKGTVEIGEPGEKAATASLMSQEFLILALHHAGVTRQSAVKAIEAVAVDYLVDWAGTSEDKKAAKKARQAKVKEIDPDKKISGIFDEFKSGLPKIPSQGVMNVKGVVCEVVSSDKMSLVG